MEKFKKEFLFISIAILPFIYLAYIWNDMPEKVPMHWNIAGEIDRWGTKSELIIMLFVLVGINYFIFLVIPYIDPKQKLQNMGNKLNTIRLILTMFLSALAIGIIYSTQQKTSNPAFVFVLIGLLIAFLGNYFKTIKPNYFIGIRTPWTLENEENWKKTHLFSGKIWFIGGLLMTLTFLFPKEYSFFYFIGITVIITILPFVYSFLEFKKTNKQ